jgi:diguanylate cyclase (GGDEF)-like protein
MKQMLTVKQMQGKQIQDNNREKIRHILVIQDGQGRRTFPLKEATYSIGREPSNSIVLHCPSVSRQHAILFRLSDPEMEQYRFRIIDGNLRGQRSTNGLIINGTRCFNRDLQHRDVIHFGTQAQAKYYALSNMSEPEFSEVCQQEDLSVFLSKSTNAFETLILPEDDFKESNETLLTRLASFPELIPDPIIEIDLAGKITYLNPAADLKFPGLKQAGVDHPLLAGIIRAIKKYKPKKEKSWLREVAFGGAIFEQSIHYLAASDLVRIFFREITAQKQAEAELKQRDRLSGAVAEAAHYLLAERQWEVAIEKSLTVLGQAVGANRAYFFESHPDSSRTELAVSLHFEEAGVKVDLSSPSCKIYSDSRLSPWYESLSAGETIRALVGDVPAPQRELLEQEGIRSLLLVPLQLNGEFWGIIGLADCQRERSWSKYEESALMTMAASLSSALERQQIEETTRHQALHDKLTGLSNRLLFDEQLKQSLPNATRNQESVAVIFLDLDRFKTINDNLGHTLGDRLLQNVALRLKESVRAGDVVARWGGDEFTLLLPRIKEVEEVIHVAQRILLSLRQVFLIDGQELYISGSIGIALFNENSPDAETLIRHADTALYRAKERGRDTFEFYEPSLSEKNPKILTLEKNLRQALERQEFLLYYQPRVDVTSKQVIGMEALLRWQNIEMGLVNPHEFIPLAEETGLIIPIGEWVLQSACAQTKAWQQAGLSSLTISVNLSPKQFRDPNLATTIARILDQTGLEPQFLELEITETMLLDELDFMQMTLHELQQMGIRLSIDDFGIGHSSLSRLQLLPFHKLKIDRSFIQELTANKKVAHIVTAIVTLGQALGLSLTAEGVEKEEELAFLQSIQCSEFQGFLFSRPLSVQQATELLQNCESHLSQKNQMFSSLFKMLDIVN